MIPRRVALAGVLVATLFAGGWLFGEQQPSTKGSKKNLPLYWNKLGLSDEQKKKAYAIQNEFRDRIEPLRAQIRQFEEEERRELSRILTEPQREQLRKIVASKTLSEPPTEDTKPKEPSKGKKPSDK